MKKIIESPLPVTPPPAAALSGDMLTTLAKIAETALTQRKYHPVIDLDKFEGIDIKVGDQVVTITKKEIVDVLAKIFPDLIPKLVLAKL